MATLKPIIKSSVTDCGMVRIEFDYRTLFDRCYGNPDQAKGKVLDTLDAILARAERAVINEGEGFPAEERIDHYCLSMVDKQDARKSEEEVEYSVHGEMGMNGQRSDIVWKEKAE